MTKIETFNRASAQAIQEKIDEIFAPHKDRLLEEFGVAIKTGRGTFYDKRFDLKIEIAVVGESGVAASKSSEDFKRYSDEIYFSSKSIVAAFEAGPDFYFMYKGTRWFVEGYRPRSRKYPFIIAKVAEPDHRLCMHGTPLSGLIEKAEGFNKIAEASGHKPADDGATEASPGDLIETQKRADG